MFPMHPDPRVKDWPCALALALHFLSLLQEDEVAAAEKELKERNESDLGSMPGSSGWRRRP